MNRVARPIIDSVLREYSGTEPLYTYTPIDVPGAATTVFTSINDAGTTRGAYT